MLQELARQAGNMLKPLVTAVQALAIHTTPSLMQVIMQVWVVKETPAGLSYCLTTSVYVKCMHSYTFNTSMFLAKL